MPLFKMKKVWDYCTYNKAFFFVILLLFCIWNALQQYASSKNIVIYLFIFLINCMVLGYGLTITRDVINGGIRLPKIMIKNVVVLGIKSIIVYLIYFFVQAIILGIISDPLNFPEFDLEDLLLQLPETLKLFFSHSPADAFIFIVLGAIVFYITTFFMEIALARLADTGDIKSAFNLKGIKRDIDLLGWKHYVKDFTLIILAIVIFSYFTAIYFEIDIINYIWDVFWMLLVFVTQYWGIGVIYSEIKEKKSHLVES